ncbi:GntR family transcriptional regulator [Amycolatopsis sp. VS8301801F10]|uniref:GntR family transcriptional regulator n=1 Tax=unclassified Amycolatopsis TaxID=2618356 RepID=UPI0038FC3F94
MAPVAGESKSQRAYRWIKDRIADRTFGPGYRLVLGQIAKELDVSVVPVREAIRLLEAEGLVTFERNVGAQVVMVDETAYEHTMQTLALVEGFATSLSAPKLSTADIERARAVNEQMRLSLENFEPHRFTELNQEFHSVLFEPCPNPHVLDLVHRGWHRLASLRDSTFSFVPGRAHESVKEHEQLLVLIEQNADPLELELAARRHRTATLDAYLDRRAAPPAEATRKDPTP